MVPVVGGPSGSGLDHPEALADLASRLGLDDVVRFVPPVGREQLADWCVAADLVAVPSYNESFGLVAVEAQATGTPVVAAAVGGLTTVVRDEVLGAARRRPRAPRLGRRAARGWSPTTRSASGSRPGAVRQAREFSWERTADRTLEVYRQAQSTAMAVAS